MALDEYSSFRTPGSVPFKWEIQPGIPKKQPTAASPYMASASSSLRLPPRLALPPAAVAAASSRVSNGCANNLASTSSSSRRSCSAASAAPLSPSSWLSSSSSRQQHRRSMSARFATSLAALPFTRPGRRGRSKDEADVAFSVLYGDTV